MAYVMKSDEFVKKAREIAEKYKTLYVMGCFGACLNEKGKARYIANDAYNKQATRTKMILSCPDDTFGFDCVGLIKGILWGWKGTQDKTKNYGGAKYAANGVPDTNAGGMFQKCKDQSTDWTKIVPGECLRCDGHIGIYIGDGLAVEATPSWKNCVQITAVANIKKSTKYPNRTWLKHGKLMYIEYPTNTYVVGDGKKEFAEFTDEEAANDYLRTIRVFKK